jgi:uncharacterized protein
MSIDYTKLHDFVKESTKHFDDSHNYSHALAVTNNAKKIAVTFDIDSEDELLNFASMLHDVCDHKYPQSISKDALYSFIFDNMTCKTKSEQTIKIINNISYSKEAKGLREQFDHPYNIYLDIISDADRLEALGKIGIERCIEFTKTYNGRIPEDVIQHCHDKLLRLLPDGFIKTEYGKELAKPLHQEILDYVNSH